MKHLSSKIVAAMLTGSTTPAGINTSVPGYKKRIREALRKVTRLNFDEIAFSDAVNEGFRISDHRE